MFAVVNSVQTPIIRAWLPLRRWVEAGSLAFIVACGVTLPLVCVSATAQTATPEQPGANAEGDQKKPDQESPAGPAAAIDGFRDAHFGMTEEQVRRAIQKDFPGPAAKLTKMVHPSEKTTVLLVSVPDLLPNTGIAQVSYILGYKSKSLIQINIIWRSERSVESDEMVVGAANSLRDFLKARSYKPGSEIANRQLGRNAIVVFRGTDAQGRTVLVVLNGGTAAEHMAKNVPPAPPLTLELSYIADPAHPDVFRIGKGQF